MKAALSEWPEIVKKYKLTAHVDDLSTVSHYIKAFNKKYKEKVSEQDIQIEFPQIGD